jgi:hypothetical protein
MIATWILRNYSDLFRKLTDPLPRGMDPIRLSIPKLPVVIGRCQSRDHAIIWRLQWHFTRPIPPHYASSSIIITIWVLLNASWTDIQGKYRDDEIPGSDAHSSASIDLPTDSSRAQPSSTRMLQTHVPDKVPNTVPDLSAYGYSSSPVLPGTLRPMTYKLPPP